MFYLCSLVVFFYFGSRRLKKINKLKLSRHSPRNDEIFVCLFTHLRALCAETYLKTHRKQHFFRIVASHKFPRRGKFIVDFCGCQRKIC